MKRLFVAILLLSALLPLPAEAACVYYTGNEYVCLSGDTKPATVADGARVYESDTRKHYLKVSGTWQLVTDPANLPSADQKAALAGTSGTPSGSNKFVTDSDTRLSISARDVINLMSTGVISGGEITQNADPAKINIDAGVGVMVNNYTNPTSPTKVDVSWNAATALTLTYLATDDETVIGINSSGSIVQQNSQFTEDQLLDIIFLGTIGHFSRTAVDYIINEPARITDVRAKVESFFEYFGPFNVTGNEFTANGGNLYLNKSAGEVFDNAAGADPKRPNIVPANTGTQPYVQYYYRTSGGTVWNFGDFQQAIDPDRYDTGNGLSSCPANNWTIQTIFLYAPLFGTGSATDYGVDIQYGQACYASYAEAAAAITSSIAFNPYLAYDVFRTWLIVKKGASVLNNTNSAVFIQAPALKFGIMAATGGGSSGEANTASNVGTAGVGFYNSKTGVNLDFKNAEAASTMLSITDYPTNKTVRFDVVPANIALSALSGLLPLSMLTDNATAGLCLVSGGAGGDPNYTTCPGGGGGDSISVNSAAATDADFDDATPAAPANSINVKWQKDAGTPNNISANVPYAAPLTVTGGNLTVVDAASGAKGAVQLTGDLGGTAASPTVVGVQCSGTCIGDAEIAAVNGSKITTTDSTTTAIGKATPTAVVANICNAGGADTCNTFRLGTHSHQNATGGGGSLDAAAIGSGTLSGARGGVGVALPTCSGTDKLTANGTQVSCATDQTAGGGPTTAKLTSTYTNSTVTGTNVSGLNVTLGAGTWRFSYYLVSQTAATTTGIDYGVAFTGTQTLLVVDMMYPDTGTTATGGNADGTVTGDGAELLMARGSVLTASTTAPNLNVITGVATANESFLARVEGVIVVTVSGTLQLWAASDVASSQVSILAGSNLLAFSH